MAWITQKKRQAIYRRDNYTCGYCGRNYSADKGRLTLDHIKPQAQGGTNKETNLVTSCDTCNQRKNNKTISEYKKWCTLNIGRQIRWDIIIKRINNMRRRSLNYENT